MAPPQPSNPRPAAEAAAVSSATDPHPLPQVNVSCPKAPQRAILTLSVLLTAVLGLLTGYVVGLRSNWLVSRITPPMVFPPAPAPVPETPDPPTKTVIIRPPVEEPKERPPEEKPAPVKASAAAEAALKAFLDAPDWTTRSAYVLSPEKVRTAMEIHSRRGPDGPTAYQSISLQNSHTDTATGNTTFIFKVVTTEHPTGIPVALMETPSGWLVDWETFIEFRDDLFKRFADGPADQTGCFHLVVSSPPPERAAKTENEHFVAFVIDPPFPDRQQLAYVRKATATQTLLSESTASGTPVTPVLELAKKSSPDGKTFLEILSIKADNWLPKTD